MEVMQNGQEYMMSRSRELFVKGFHCSQAVFQSAAETFGFEDYMSVISSLAPFGGGMGSTGNVCGSLSGAIAVFGFLWGKQVPNDHDKRPMWRLSYKMVKKFESITSRYNGIDCRAIVGVNWSDRDAIKAFRSGKDGKRDRCLYVIEQTSKELYTMLKQNL